MPDTVELPLLGVVSVEDILNARAHQAACGKKGVFIQTLGCQMNEHDTEIMLGLLIQAGYHPVDNMLAADLILFNTCCVRENPERKVYGQVRMLQALKEYNPKLIIGICGCMTQQPVQRKQMINTLKHVDLIFGTHNIHRLPELLHQVETSGQQVVEVWDEVDDIVENLPAQRADWLKAYVTIMYGCNERCTYCIVPFVRGHERSRQPQAIIDEIRSLTANGCKEVMLLGQNVNAYGHDLGSQTTFANLLRQVNEVPGMARIRYTSPHPRYFTADVIDAMAEAEAVCEHVHLPVQAGSDIVLRRMGRRYTRAHYIDLVARMRQAIPNLAVTTDFIVGFPGETDADFEQTLSLVREVEFDNSFMFIYSPREGTAATRLPNPVPDDVKTERIHRLIELQKQISLRRNQALIGSVEEVLVDSLGKNPGTLAGRTRSNKLVVFKDEGQKIGDLVSVRISTAFTWSLSGDTIEKPH